MPSIFSRLWSEGKCNPPRNDLTKPIHRHKVQYSADFGCLAIRSQANGCCFPPLADAMSDFSPEPHSADSSEPGESSPTPIPVQNPAPDSDPVFDSETHSGSPATIPSRLPQPGLLWAVLMVLGVVLIHMVSTSAYFMAAHPELFTENPRKPGPSLLEQLESGEMFGLLAFEQGLFVMTVFALTWLAFRKRFLRVIPFKIPAFRHVGLICLLVLPLAVMDSFLAQTLINVCESMFGTSPSQGDLPAVLDGVTQNSSTLMLLLILAVMPALGEELVFRGVIGRGLIARKGIIAGVLWTSLLFSVVHVNPVQAVGVFFVGVMCHVSYLATRSLAAPMLLHFLNNALPVFALKQLAAARCRREQPAKW